MQKKRKTRKKRSRRKKIIITMLVFVIFCASGLCTYVYKLSSNIKKVNVTLGEMGLDNAVISSNKDVSYGKFREHERYINIALFGIDTRNIEEYEGCRSDCIMVLTIDRENKNVKLASIARDTYTEIDGRGMDKITHAYAFGGPALAVKTINQNFNLGVTDFVCVNFIGLADIIDRLGGVDIEISGEEIEYINGYIDEISNLKGVEPKHINSAGVYNLTGVQAVAYSRIRYTSGGDFKRTERQREVLTELGKKGSTIKLTDVMPIVSQLSSNLMTTLSVNDMYNIASEAIEGGYINNIEQNMFPESDYASGQMINGVYYYVGDIDQTKQRMHEFLFDE